MDTIKVMVVGTTGTGKTGIARLIAMALKDHGISTTVTDDEPIQLYGPATVGERLREISNRTKVEIITVQAIRDSLSADSNNQ